MRLSGLKWDGTIWKRRGIKMFPDGAVFTDSTPPTSGKVNTYTCPFRHETVTRHIDEGVTPFMIECRCGRMAYSSFYGCDQNPRVVHAVWMREPNSWWGSEAAQKHHYENGGVFLYYIHIDNQLLDTPTTGSDES